MTDSPSRARLSPRGERRCMVGVGPHGENTFEQFVRGAWTDELIREIWEQASQGVFFEHPCPAMFACAAILAALRDAGYCPNCCGRIEACREANKQQKKCCPDCEHEK